MKSALLVLEDGTRFHDWAIGTTGSVVREIVFDTSTTGYQEILTDPSYSRQIVTPTYLHIGNVGANDADEESSQTRAQGLVVHNLLLITSNSRNTENLSSYLKHHNAVAVVDTNTRKLTRLLREKGAQNGYIIVDDNPDAALALEEAHAFPGLNGMDLAKEVTTAEPYSRTQESWTLTGGLLEAKKEDELSYHAMAYDFGAKRNILRMLVDKGCCLTTVPAQAPTEDMLKVNPDGIFLSSGPGDPAPCDYAITAIQEFLETDIPVFGICLGHRLLTLASDAKTVRTKSGHHGGNRPIKDVEEDVVIIIVQGHGFAVGEVILSANLRVTHKPLLGGTLQGIHRTDELAFSFQGHPEAGPGPHNVAPLFGHFIALVEQYREAAK